MNPQPIEYAAVRLQPRVPYGPLKRYLIAGPATGAAIGAGQTLAPAMLWVLAGKPRFYFEDYEQVAGYTALFSVIGLFLGLVSGVALRKFEKRTQSNVRPIFVLVWSAAGASVVAGLIAILEYHRNAYFDWNISQRYMAVFVSMIFAAITARERSTDATLIAASSRGEATVVQRTQEMGDERGPA